MTTYTSQPDESSGIDTAINSYAATTNYGTAVALSIGGISGDPYRSLIKFDFSSIPSSALVTDATLTLTTKADYCTNARTMRVYRQKRAWVETQATWNIYSTGNSWATAGGFGAADCEQTDVGNVALANNIANNTAVNITLTASAVQDMISGAFTNNGFLIKNDTEVLDGYDWHSSAGTTASYRPKMVINYTLPGGCAFTCIL